MAARLLSSIAARLLVGRPGKQLKAPGCPPNFKTFSGLLLIGTTILMLADFVGRGVLEAWSVEKNDFSIPYCGGFLWRNAQNPYDVTLATTSYNDLAHSHFNIVPVYPLTTYALVAPLTLLPWRVANVTWALLGIAGVIAVAHFLVRILASTGRANFCWLVVCFVFAFAPIHTAIHVNNVVMISLVLSVWAFYLASTGQEIAAGVALAISIGLKPQLGLWIFLFYLLQRRWRLVGTVALAGAILLGVALIPFALSSVPGMLRDYTENVRYFSEVGREMDFTTANPSRSQLINLQVMLYPVVRTIPRANFLSWALWLLGIVIWFLAFVRTDERSQNLALSSLLALSLAPIYHRWYDASFLIFSLCWCLSEERPFLRRSAQTALVLLLIFMLPCSVVIRAQSSLPGWVNSSWWWNALVAPYAAWTLLAFNVVLLNAMYRAAALRCASGEPHRSR